MALTITIPARNAAVNAVTALAAGGVLRFFTASDALVAEVALGNPAFDQAINGTARIPGSLTDPFTSSGTVTKFSILSSGGTLLMSGTVTAVGGGGDIELSTTTYVSGDRLDVSTLTYSQPAS